MSVKVMKGLEGKAPDKPHLIAYTDGAQGLATALPVGCMMGVVERPKERDPMHRMVLTKATRDELRFRCTCSPQCTREYVYRMSKQGAHPRSMPWFD